jgi:hypothetical protein
MAKKSCKKGYYYCYTSKKCKRIPMGYYVGGGGWLRKEDESDEGEGKKKNGNGNGNGNGSHSNGNGNGNGGSDGGSDGGGGGGVSEAWSAKYKKSINCDNPKGFSQRAHCGGRKKVSEEAVSKKQQKFFGIVRAIQKGEIEPTTPETAEAARDMKKSDVKKFASTKHDKLPEKVVAKEESNPRIPRKKGQPANSKKHSDLYTDENPKGTIHGLGFKDVATAKASVAKIKKSSRSHAHKIQAAIAMEQRARVMGKTSEAAVFRKFINSMKKKTKQMNEEVIVEKRDGKSAKSKGYSLRDWFKGGGWVQAGGKYDGKPCAKQPGQKTKPFCRDADDRANMSKKERSRRSAKKRREDPNPNRKGKAKMVSASYSNWRNELQLNEGMGLGIAAGAAALAAAPYLAKKFLKPKADKAIDKQRKTAPIGGDRRVPQTEGYDEIRSYDRIKRLDGRVRSLDDDKRDKNKKAKPTVQLDKAHFEPQGDLVDEGKKDACYHKVKSRYSVWPSAYASGALVKCRKVGAKNWGNKTKKEGYEFSNWRDDFQATEYESVDIIKAEPLQPSQGIGSDMLDEAGKKCWKGYKKAGTQKLFGKTYNRCVKAHFSDWRADMELQEDWQKSNRKDGVDGMSQKSVDAYKRENPGSKLKTAVTGKVKKGSKDSKRRKSFCARSDGQRKMHNIDCKKTPDKKICKARRRWKC